MNFTVPFSFCPDYKAQGLPLDKYVYDFKYCVALNAAQVTNLCIPESARITEPAKTQVVVEGSERSKKIEF